MPSGGKAVAVHANTAVEADIERVYAQVDALGSLAVMVYNAGITGAHSPLADASTATIDEVLAVNLRGAILCSREAIRRMSTRFAGKGGVDRADLLARCALWVSDGICLVCSVEGRRRQSDQWPCA